MSGYPTSTQAHSNSSAWRELAPLLRPHRFLIAVIAVTVLLAEAFAVLPALLMVSIIDEHLSVGVQQGVLALALLYFGARAIAEGLDFVVTYLTGYVAQKTLRELRVHLFAHLERLPLSYYDTTPLGDAISRCTADVDTVDTLFTTGISRLLTQLVQLFTALVAMVILSPPLAMVAVMLIPPLALITRFFQVHIRDAERDRRREIGSLNVHLQETLGGVEVVRTFGQEDNFNARFRLALRRTLAAYQRALSYNVFYSPLLTVLVAASVAFLLWIGTGGLGLSLSITIGTLTAFILLFQRFFEPIRNLGEDWQTVQSAASGIERVVEVLEIPQEHIVTPENAAHTVASSTNGTDDDDPVVEIRNVVFGYLPDQPILHAISLAIQPNEHLALVGRSGAGKSSLVNLLCGLYEPWSGEIRVAGANPRSFTDAERRSAIGVVPQTVHLFGGTIWDNLTLGDDSISRGQIEWAASITGVDRIVSTLPEGYDTRLSGAGRGEGVQLSEGQQQLLSLTRALILDPALLLLDEATAAVDSISEAEFRSALRAAIHNDEAAQSAVLTVAHRLSTAREADRVLVMEGGTIIEEGAPEDLIRQGGRFAAMVELEAAGWNWQSDL